MYPYHNRIKQRIAAGELADFFFTDDWPRIGPALVLVFRTDPVFRPIRPHRWKSSPRRRFNSAWPHQKLFLCCFLVRALTRKKAGWPWP